MLRTLKAYVKNIPIQILVICTAITIGLTYFTIQHTNELVDQRITAEAALIRSAIENQFKKSATALEGLQAFVSATPFLSRETFSNFTTPLVSRQSSSGLLAFGFAPMVSSQNKSVYETSQSVHFNRQEKITPPGKRHNYAPLALISLENEEKSRSYNFDLMSNPSRKRALMATWSTGIPAITSPIKLNNQAELGQAFLMALHTKLHPKSNLALKGIEAGFVTSAFTVREFVDSLNLKWITRSHFALMDFQEKDTHIYESAGFKNEPSFASINKVSTIGFGGRAWKLILQPAAKSEYLSLPETMLPFFVCTALILVGTALSLIASLLISRKKTAETLAHQMSRKYRVASMRSTAALKDAETSSKLMKESLSQLKALNSSLNRYAAITAHDLKSPLKRVSAMVDLLIEDHTDQINNDGKDILNRIKRSTDKMNGMVSSLLTYSSSKFDEKEARLVSIVDLVNSTIEAMAMPDLNSMLNLTIDDAELIYCNPDLITHVLQNLISNARKFNKAENIEISIDAKTLKNGTTEITVSDNGIGIPPEHADKIFEMFTRLHNDREFVGHGIGLATCQRIIFDHGGKIAVDKKYKNGARIKVSLPPRDQRAIKQGLKSG